MKSVLADAEVYIINNYLDDKEGRLFNWLANNLGWSAPMAGGRKTATLGADYYFSGRMHHGAEIPRPVQKVMDRINKTYNLNLNMCHANFYTNSSAGLGFHQDNEREIVPGSSVVSLTLGVARPFWFQKVADGRRKSFMLNNGTLCIMGKDSQVKYKHGLLSDKDITGQRISLTFREFFV